MPKGTPSIKVTNVQRLGAKVVLHGSDFDEAKAECAHLAAAHGLTFVPPYDDPLVIAGQGTTAMEILKQLPDSDNLNGIFGAIGGGGLISGIAEYVKRIGNPKTKICGAETVDADAMYQSLKKGHRVTLPEVGPFSDGTAVRLVGAEPFRICQRLLDEIVLVNNDELCAAIKDIFEGTFQSQFAPPRFDDRLFVAETRSITEPAGALALAGLKHYIVANKLVGAQQKFVVVVSGANMNFDRLRFVAERAELGEGREALLSVELPEKPGTYVLMVIPSTLLHGFRYSFFGLHSIIYPRSVTEFAYRYNSPDLAHVFLSFKLESSSRTKEVSAVLDAIQQAGFKGFDISDNEMAKSHTRYMVGGCRVVPDERLFRFGGFKVSFLLELQTRPRLPAEFPERPGALRKFLEGLQQGWNISLFQYRNHGAGQLFTSQPCHHLACNLDVGRVLTGIQVPPKDCDQFQQFLDKLGYHYVEETDNEVYKRYLRG